MMKSNKLRRLIHSAAVVLTAAALSFTSCTDSNDLLGGEMLPGNQEMLTGTIRLAKTKRFFETRLYQTDSVKAANLGYGYFGAMRNDTTGLVHSGFVSQFLNYYRIDSGYFGYRPIFDSAQIVLSVKTYSRDTLTPQLFYIYEVKSSEYLKTGDSVFYVNFNPTPYIDPEPLFSFTFPNGTSTGPSTKSVTLSPEKKGLEFVKRLMISDGTKPYDEKVGYSIYKDDKKFIEAFKGLYIRPAHPETMGTGKGSIFGVELAASGFTIYGRSRVKDDPTLIKDTVASVYYFSNSDFTNNNQSVNVVRHDYTGSQINIDDAKETNPNRPLSAGIVVSGMGGVLSELTFTQEFFDALETELSNANEVYERVGNDKFTTFAMNRALMTIYFTGADYDWQNIDPWIVTPLMSAAISRFGSYTNFKKLTAVPGYDYYAEKNYGTTLSYDGYINRTQGCYTLDISGYLQDLWNSYLEAKKSARDGKVDLSLVKNRSIYLAPDAYALFTTSFAKVQGMDDPANTAPVKMDLTYTLIR